MSTPGPRRYVKQRPNASQRSLKDDDFTYFFRPGTEGSQAFNEAGPGNQLRSRFRM